MEVWYCTVLLMETHSLPYGDIMIDSVHNRPYRSAQPRGNRLGLPFGKWIPVLVLSGDQKPCFSCLFQTAAACFRILEQS